MRRFAFSLYKLLELREWKKKRAEAALAAASGRCALIEADLAANAERSAANARSRFAKGGGIAEFRAAELFGKRLERERERLFEALAKAELERELARTAWIEASREFEAVETLRERRMAEYYKAAAREEVRVLDDVGQTTRAIRLIREAEAGIAR